MKKNTNAKQLLSLIVVLCLLVIVVFYMFVYKKTVEKTEALNNSNKELALSVAELKNYYDNMVQYQTDIETWKLEIRLAALDYSSLIQEEDIIMQAANSMKVTDHLAFTAASITSTEVFYSVPAELFVPVNFTDDENDKFYNNVPMLFSKRNAAYVANCDYTGLKSMVSDVVTRLDKTLIRNIVFEKNEEFNNLEGTMEVDFYYMPVYGRDYVPVPMAEYKKGLEELFKFREEQEEKPEKEDASEEKNADRSKRN